jgi:hypothetical protein
MGFGYDARLVKAASAEGCDVHGGVGGRVWGRKGCEGGVMRACILLPLLLGRAGLSRVNVQGAPTSHAHQLTTCHIAPGAAPAWRLRGQGSMKAMRGARACGGGAGSDKAAAT